MPYLFEGDEHTALRAEVRRWAQKEIAPHSARWEEDEEFPIELYWRAGAASILGIGYPESVGGAGGDITHMAVAADELIQSGRSVGTVVGLGSHSIALLPILHEGTEEQRERFIRPVLRGEKIAALAITEPGSGSDVAGLMTRAVRDGDVYLVHGEKTFITSGTRADFVVAAVRTGASGHHGISLLVIESKMPGFHVSKKLRKTGWWASDTAEISFENCLVPVTNLIGQENLGFETIMRNFVAERLLLAVQCVAISELAHRESIQFAKGREAFGRPIAAFQVTRHKLAEMAGRIAAARALTSELAVRYRRGEQVSSLAAMTKNIAADACSFVCHEAVQIHGGAGDMHESLVERLYRDARLYPIGGGTREITNEIIAKMERFG